MHTYERLSFPSFHPSLKLISRSQIAINYCTNGQYPCAPVGSVCTFTGPANYTCACAANYTGSGTICNRNSFFLSFIALPSKRSLLFLIAAVDNCTNGVNDCAPVGSLCQYIGPGTYSCSCTGYFVGNGTVCTRRLPTVSPFSCPLLIPYIRNSYGYQ